MILIDNTQIILASLFSQYRSVEEILAADDPLNLVRHITLNTYRMYKQKFSDEFGDLVICQDAGNYWRKDIFPYYKFNRKKSQESDQEYWDRIYKSLTTIRNEIVNNFPYKNMRVERCEADDIIAVLTKAYHQTEKIVIVSNDKDFKQLLIYPNVYLYSPQKKAFVECNDPQGFLLEQVIRGDTSDGVPNILSEDDAIVNPEKRQKPITAKKYSEIMTNYSENINFERNSKLIDLSYIPTEYEDAILAEYAKPAEHKNNLFNYFVEHKLINLMDSISEF